MLPCQGRHRVDMLDDKLTVGHPQLHIRQIRRVEARLLHRLVEGVEQRVVRLVDLHALPGQRRRLRIVAEDQADGLLIGLQCIMGILAQQPALPLWPQPDHSTESNQAANQGIG